MPKSEVLSPYPSVPIRTYPYAIPGIQSAARSRKGGKQERFILGRTDGTLGTTGTCGTRMRHNQKDFFHLKNRRAEAAPQKDILKKSRGFKRGQANLIFSYRIFDLVYQAFPDFRLHWHTRRKIFFTFFQFIQKILHFIKQIFIVKTPLHLEWDILFPCWQRLKKSQDDKIFFPPAPDLKQREFFCGVIEKEWCAFNI